jgi:hypothetical protein
MAAVARDYSSPTAKHNIFPAAAMHTLVPRWVTRVISTERQSLPLLPQEPTFGCSTISVATALFASSIVQATGTGARACRNGRRQPAPSVLFRDTNSPRRGKALRGLYSKGHNHPVKD